MNRRNFLIASSGAVGAALLPTNLAFAIPKKENVMDASQFHASRKFIHLPVSRVAYIDHGHGPVVLFLHGYPLNGFQWRGAIAHLSKHRRCIAADFMGLGYTDTPEGQDVSPSAQADMLAHFLDALEIDSVDLIANDSGGAIAQIFVARYPLRVRTLLLTNCDVNENSPPPSFKPVVALGREGVWADQFAVPNLTNREFARSPKGLGGLAYTNPANLTDEAIDVYLAPLVKSPLRKTQFNAYTAAFEPNPLLPIASALQKSSVPLRIVWGTADVFFNIELAEWLDKNFPHSQGIRRVEGAKLFFPEEMPEIIAEEATKLWASTPKPKS